MGISNPEVIEPDSASDILPAVRRQRYSVARKRKMVEETLAPGASVARVARAHGVNANQVFQWRRQYGQGRLGSPSANVSRLLPVSVAATAAATIAEAGEASSTLSTGHASGAASGAIHLELRKARLRIEGNVDPAMLSLVLKAVLG